MIDPTTRRVLASHALAATAMSLPWPLLLVMIWEDVQSDSLLGIAGAARMAPYVVLSWWVARLADHYRRDRLVRATLVLRVLLLTGTSIAVFASEPGVGVVLATLAVAVSTPAYPALAAGLPGLAGRHSVRATDLLVTIEVTSFVVGPAVGGLLLGVPLLVGPLAVAATVAAWALYAGVYQPRPAHQRPTTDDGAPRRRQWCAATWTALAVLAGLNGVLAATAVALLPMAELRWADWDWEHATAYGLATAALGFGGLLGPALSAVSGSTRSRMGIALVLAGAGLAGAVLAPSLGWAALPLLLVGAAAVCAEGAATVLLQQSVPDDHRAGILGLADTAMVTAAMLGALVAPLLAASWGARPLLMVLGACCVAGVQLERLATRYATTRPRSTTAIGSRSTASSVKGSRG